MTASHVTGPFYSANGFYGPTYTYATLPAASSVAAGTQFWTSDQGMVVSSGTSWSAVGSANLRSVKSYGAVGDGIANDSAAISAALSSGYSIFFPEGNYRLSTELSITASDILIVGENTSVTIYSDTLINPIVFNTLSNVTFQNITFSTTVTDAVENVYGIIRSNNTAITNVSFINCIFTAPNANTNAVKFINESTQICNQLSFIGCQFNNILRMGVETQNHAVDTTNRYRGLNIQGCQFNNVGSASTYGIAISLSGYGENCIINDNTFNNVKLGVELVGASDTTVAFNKFKSFPTGGKPMSFTGSRIMYRNRVIGNSMESAALADTYFWTQQDLVMQGNYWNQSASTYYFKDVVRARISDEQVETTGAYALYIEGTSSDIQFMNCRFSNSGSATNFATVRTYGSGVTDIWLIGCSLAKGTGGNYYDAANGAALAKLYLCKAAGSLYGDVIPSGYSYKTGIQKTAGAATNNTTLTVVFGSTGSWSPAMVSVRVRTIKNDSSGSGYTENRLYLAHQGTNNVTVSNNQVIGTASGLTITTTASTANTLVITCTHATATGDQLYFLWDVEVDTSSLVSVS